MKYEDMNEEKQKLIDKWYDEIICDPYCYYFVEHLHEKIFKNIVISFIVGIEEYYGIYEEGDEFKEIDVIVDAHKDELVELIKKWKKELRKSK